MFNNLIASLESAFDGKISTRIDSRGMLVIRLDNVELCINERGEQTGVSGVGAASLNIDVDRRGAVIAAPLTTVEALSQ